MKVEKINSKEIICILTEEELYFDYDMELSDITENTPEAKQKIVEIIASISEKVNFHVKHRLEATVTINQYNELVIHAISKDKDQDNVKEEIKETKAKKKEDFENFIDKTYTEVNRTGNKEYILEFNDILNIFDIIEKIPFSSNNNSLYKCDNKYYLVCEEDLLFSHYIYEWILTEKDILFKYYLEEHGKLIIENNAIETLRKVENTK